MVPFVARSKSTIAVKREAVDPKSVLGSGPSFKALSGKVFEDVYKLTVIQSSVSGEHANSQIKCGSCNGYPVHRRSGDIWFLRASAWDMRVVT